MTQHSTPASGPSKDPRSSTSPDSLLPAKEVSRRGFFSTVGGTALGAAALGVAGATTSCSDARGNVVSSQLRAEQSLVLRKRVADVAFLRDRERQESNGDENRYPDFFASYAKGLPHLANGQVDPAAYEVYRRAIDTGDYALLETLTYGPRKLVNPQSALCYALQGADPSNFAMPPAPTFASAETAGEMVELYWRAICRDIYHEDYATHPDIAAAVADLNALSDYRGPRSGGLVTPATIFRGPAAGALVGPFISQLLLRDVPFGTLVYEQRQRTHPAGVSYLTDFNSWLALQNGQAPAAPQPFDGTKRYIRNERDLGAMMRDDVSFQAPLNAALILLGLGVPLKPGIREAYGMSASQVGFSTFGGPHIVDLVTNIAIHALRCVWYQKWNVHRRLRPEEYAGRVHAMRNMGGSYPIHGDVMNSAAVARIESTYGTALLPMAWVEGCPNHPAYGAGHASIGSACVAALKAIFDTNWVFPNPVVASADGLSLVPYTGSENLTVGGELDKLACNIWGGREAGGVHWRSDDVNSMPFAEKVTEALLAEQQFTFNENATFRYTRFDGSESIILPV